MERAQPAAGTGELHFDDIRRMDAQEVQRSVQAARARHDAPAARDPALTELSRRICVSAGLPYIVLECSPLRTSVFVEGITAALTHLPVAAVVRQGWITVMSGALGQMLGPWYRAMAAELEQAAAQARAAGPPSGPAPLVNGRPTQLTLERLRELLTADEAVPVGARAYPATGRPGCAVRALPRRWTMRLPVSSPRYPPSTRRCGIPGNSSRSCTAWSSAASVRRRPIPTRRWPRRVHARAPPRRGWSRAWGWRW